MKGISGGNKNSGGKLEGIIGNNKKLEWNLKGISGGNKKVRKNIRENKPKIHNKIKNRMGKKICW